MEVGQGTQEKPEMMATTLMVTVAPQHAQLSPTIAALVGLPPPQMSAQVFVPPQQLQVMSWLSVLTTTVTTTMGVTVHDLLKLGISVSGAQATSEATALTSAVTVPPSAQLPQPTVMTVTLSAETAEVVLAQQRQTGSVQEEVQLMLTVVQICVEMVR